MDTQKLRALLDQRDALDEQIRELVTGSPNRRPQACGNCGETGHSSRTCTKKDIPQKPVDNQPKGEKLK